MRYMLIKHCAATSSCILEDGRQVSQAFREWNRSSSLELYAVLNNNSIMRIINIVIALDALLPVASPFLMKRLINDPVGLYLNRMCYPLYSNRTRLIDLNITISEIGSSLAKSPFPCEQQMYIETVCAANGTTEIDFLAEQECLCNGAFFDVIAGCDACFIAHGYQASTPQAESSALASLSAAECQPSPPFQPYSNLFPPVNLTSISLRPPITLGIDRFPNNTAVSNYWTPTRSITPGKITGSATARLTSWTNTRGVRYTPTSIPPNSGITSSPSISTLSASVSGNIAAGKEVHVAGGLFAAVLGAVVML